MPQTPYEGYGYPVKGLVVDTNDPEGRNRLKVRIICYHGKAGLATSTNDDSLPWAQVIVPPQSIAEPQMFMIGDIVWCLFEGGDIRYPVVIGGLGLEISLGAGNESEPTSTATGDGSVISDGLYTFPVQGPWSYGPGYLATGSAYLGNSVRHTGVDIRAAAGTKLVANCTGTITTATKTYSGSTYPNGPMTYGNCVYITNAEGVIFIYGHMQTVTVNVGDVVKSGDEIGTVGSTGYSTGPHLHFEARRGGSHTDPMDFLPTNTPQ